MRRRGCSDAGGSGQRRHHHHSTMSPVKSALLLCVAALLLGAPVAHGKRPGDKNNFTWINHINASTAASTATAAAAAGPSVVVAASNAAVLATHRLIGGKYNRPTDPATSAMGVGDGIFCVVFTCAHVLIESGLGGSVGVVEGCYAVIYNMPVSVAIFAIVVVRPPDTLSNTFYTASFAARNVM